MGSYVYRVTAQTITLPSGEAAHVAKYAYKPTYSGWDGGDAQNRKWAFKSGCFASDRMTLKSEFIALVSERPDGLQVASVYHNRFGLKTFLDDPTFSSDRMPFIGYIKQHGKRWVESTAEEANAPWRDA